MIRILEHDDHLETLSDRSVILDSAGDAWQVHDGVWYGAYGEQSAWDVKAFPPYRVLFEPGEAA